MGRGAEFAGGRNRSGRRDGPGGTKFYACNNDSTGGSGDIAHGNGNTTIGHYLRNNDSTEHNSVNARYNANSGHHDSGNCDAKHHDTEYGQPEHNYSQHDHPDHRHTKLDYAEHGHTRSPGQLDGKSGGYVFHEPEQLRHLAWFLKWIGEFVCKYARVFSFGKHDQ